MTGGRKLSVVKFLGLVQLAAALLCTNAVSNVEQSLDTKASAPPDSAKASAIKLIDQLDDPDPKVRQSASLRLNSLAAEALDVAESAAKSGDLSPEAKGRLQTALIYIRPRAAAQRRRAAFENWQHQLFHNAYKNGGHTDPKYDAGAHAAIDQYLTISADLRNVSPSTRERVVTSFENAEANGCDDPMIRALHRLAIGIPRGQSTRPRQGDEAVMYNCCQANYPPAIKFHVWSSFATARLFVDTDDIKLLVGWLEQAMADPSFHPLEVDQRLDPLVRTSAFYLDAPGWKDVFDKYAAVAPHAPGPLLFRALTARNAARNYRADQTARNQFDDKARTEFDRQIADAIQLADQAYQRDPADGRAADFVLDLLQSLRSETGDADPTMQTWFERAIAADPDSRRPYELKLSYLEASDGGVAKILEFGHECLQSQNWRGAIPMFVVAAHDCLADHSLDRTAYFLRPDVWDDISQAYEGGLINFPDDLQHRCEYAKLAGQCGHWDIADAQFQIISDHPVIAVFGSESTFKYLRAKAHRLANSPSTGK